METMKLMITNYEVKTTEEKAEKVKSKIINEKQSDSFVNGFLNLV